MSKKYLITKVIAGEKQGFLKNVTKDGEKWINDHNEALTFLNLEDAENFEMVCSFHIAVVFRLSV